MTVISVNQNRYPNWFSCCNCLRYIYPLSDLKIRWGSFRASICKGHIL